MSKPRRDVTPVAKASAPPGRHIKVSGEATKTRHSIVECGQAGIEWRVLVVPRRLKQQILAFR